MSVSENIEQLRQQLQAFEATGPVPNPITGRFIESLCRRASEAEPPLAALLADKAAAVLEQYQHGSNSLGGNGRPQIDASSALTQLLSDIDRRQQQVATAARKWDDASSHNARVNDSIQANNDRSHSQLSNDDPLLSLSNSNHRELTSVRLFRESLVKLSSDKLVSRIIKEAPENPGPLNPQMLVIRSLSTMRDLSPDYLNRFVAYVDTLQWLEQATALKKTPASRSPSKKKKSKD